MKLTHALGFLIVGIVLGLVPSVAPQWCPANGLDGTSARALWLGLMGWVQMGLGGAVLAGRALSVMAVFMEYRPAMEARPRTAEWSERQVEFPAWARESADEPQAA